MLSTSICQTCIQQKRRLLIISIFALFRLINVVFQQLWAIFHSKWYFRIFARKILENSFYHFDINGQKLFALPSNTFTLPVKLMCHYALRIVRFFTFYRNKIGSRLILRTLLNYSCLCWLKETIRLVRTELYWRRYKKIKEVFFDFARYLKDSKIFLQLKSVVLVQN